MSSSRLIQPNEKKKDSKSSCYSFWSNPSLRNRLNLAGIVSSVSDNLIDSISSLSSSFSELLSKNIPYYVTGLFYFLPTVLPFVPNVMNSCRTETITSYEELLDDELTTLSLMIKRDLESGGGISQEAGENLLAEIERCQKKREKHELIDLMITLIYGVLRDVQSVVIFMEGARLSSEATGSKISNFVEFISGIISAMYTCARLVNSHQARKASLKKAELLIKHPSRSGTNLFTDQSNPEAPEPRSSVRPELESNVMPTATTDFHSALMPETPTRGMR